MTIMTAAKMHADEIDTDPALVRRLLAEQFPQWADLTITPVASAGTDNAIFRLGADMAVRRPRVAWAAGQAQKEHRWLPVLAPHLPLAIPVQLGLGSAGEGFPWRWSVCGWLEGEHPDPLGERAETGGTCCGGRRRRRQFPSGGSGWWQGGSFRQGGMGRACAKMETMGVLDA